jgi:hypothetical protein
MESLQVFRPKSCMHFSSSPWIRLFYSPPRSNSEQLFPSWKLMTCLRKVVGSYLIGILVILTEYCVVFSVTPDECQGNTLK